MPPVIGQPTAAAGDESDPAWVVKSVTMLGAVNDNLSDFVDVDTITWTLNNPDEATLHFAKNNDTDTGNVLSRVQVLDTNEIQIYRNGDLMFWGPITGYHAAASEGAVSFDCAGVDYYLNRRFLDGPQANLLTNPDFENGLTSWTAVGASASVVTDNFILGAHALQLTGAGGDQYLEQVVNSPSNGVGLLITLSGWLYVDSQTAVPYQARGLYVEAWQNGVFKGNNYQPIDLASPGPIKNWYKLHTTIGVPPNTVYQLRVRLYAPIGTVHWDDIKLVAMDSLSTATLTNSVTTPVDIAAIVGLMVQHVQDTSKGKSVLRITNDAATTGVKMVKTWQYVDHVQFDQGLQEFQLRGDGLDHHLSITPTTRAFKTYNGKRGTDRSGSVTLRYDISSPSTSNVIAYRLTADGGQLVTHQTILGEDNGPDREQAISSDTSSVNGLVLQDVKQAPQGTAIVSLAHLADEQISRYKSVPQMIELDVHGSEGLIPTLHTGDLVHVIVKENWIQVIGDRRIMAIKLDRRQNLMTVTVAQDTL